MVFLYVVEMLVVVLVFVFFLFQVIIPVWNGTLMFPFFRFRARVLDKQLRQAQSDLELAEQEKKLEALRQQNKKPEQETKEQETETKGISDVA